MGRLDAPKKRPINPVRVTDTSDTSTSTNTAGKRKRKRKRMDKMQSTENASTAPAPFTKGGASALEKRRTSHGNAARDPRDEPAARKPKLPLARLSPSAVMDFDGLSRPSNGTRSRTNEGPEQAEERLGKLRDAVRTLLECIGEDPNREGLLATPSRYAKALTFLTKGYRVNVKNVVNDALFHE